MRKQADSDVEEIAIAEDGEGHILVRTPTLSTGKQHYWVGKNFISVEVNSNGEVAQIIPDRDFPDPWIRWILRNLYSEVLPMSYRGVSLSPRILPVDRWADIDKIEPSLDDICMNESHIYCREEQIEQAALDIEEAFVRLNIYFLSTERAPQSRRWRIEGAVTPIEMAIFLRHNNKEIAQLAYTINMPNGETSEKCNSLAKALKSSGAFAPHNEVEAWFKEHTPKGVRWLVDREGLQAYSLLGLESPLVGPWTSLVEWHNAQAS